MLPVSPLAGRTVPVRSPRRGSGVSGPAGHCSAARECGRARRRRPVGRRPADGRRGGWYPGREGGSREHSSWMASLSFLAMVSGPSAGIEPNGIPFVFRPYGVSWHSGYGRTARRKDRNPVQAAVTRLTHRVLECVSSEAPTLILGGADANHCSAVIDRAPDTPRQHLICGRSDAHERSSGPRRWRRSHETIAPRAGCFRAA